MSRQKNERRVPGPDRPKKVVADTSQSKNRRVSTAVWVVISVTIVIGTLVGLGTLEEGPVLVERDPVAVAAGEELFVASCAVCHGLDLRGSPTGPPFLVPTYAPNHHGDEAFQRAAAFGTPAHHWGFGDMAPIPGLSRDDVSQIIEYVRSVQEAEGVLIDPTHG